MDLCSYYTAFEVEKVRTVNYILASSHHDRMRGAMLFCPGVIFWSSKQSLKLYKSPIDEQRKHEQNLKRIMRQSLVDVGLSIARPSDLFWWLYTLWITLLQYCWCWWPCDAANEVMIICYCIKPFNNPEYLDLNTRNIDFLRKWLVKRICLSFTGDDPIHTISMTGLSNQSKYTKGAKTSND